MKIKLLLILICLSASIVFNQSMIVKKSDGSYQEISITDAVELYFYQPCPGTATVSYEGRTYNTVQIGSQCWLKENLDVGTRVDGSSNQTNNSTVEKYCYNDDPANCTTYGGLYQWDEAMQYVTTEGAQGICPTGWHIPTATEFLSLKTYVSNDAAKLKSTGSNLTGFSALISGMRYLGTFLYLLTDKGDFWSSSGSGDSAFYMELFINPNNSIYTDYVSKINYGFSIRCLKN